MVDALSIDESDKKSQPSFSYRQTADILNVSPTTISNAVKDEKIETVKTGGQWDRIPASEVVKYGSKWQGIDAEYLREEIQERTGASDNQVLKWIILGMGIMWLINEINK